MNKFALVVKQDDHSHHIAAKIKAALCEGGWTFDLEKAELIICVGGDGTILQAVHQYMDQLQDVQFLGVHTGTLGFLTDYTQNELEEVIQAILTTEPEVYESKLLEITAYGKEVKRYYALNEMRIENVIRTQILEISIDEEQFEICRGSGVCLSTQAGSTAYNRSLRGAVIDSGLSIMQLCEITGIQNSLHRSLNVPYIMTDTRTVAFRSHTFDEATLCYDHLHASLEGIKKVTCRMSNKKVIFSRYRPYSYLKRLKNLY